MLNHQQQVDFSELWADAQPAVTAHVRAIIRDADAARDIVQNVAVVLLRKFDLWDPDRGFLPWALGFAKFEILAHWRDAERRRVVLDGELLDSITEMWPAATAEIEVERAALQDCLQKLPPHARELVHLRYYEDLPMPEVAERVGSSPGAVRVALLRIRRQLLSCVNRCLETLRGET
ncbi:MAG: sigma-70 family RNA polymerase sigma factor [Planctomycetaceae bacterium]|nr:sigma-70 family RNA polymerase sigma factor [Planctomycetaceae bacterium]